MADYMLVFVPQKILSPLGILGQNIMLLCQYAERKSIVDNQLAIFIIFLFCFSFYCLYTVRKLYVHAPSLLLHFC